MSNELLFVTGNAAWTHYLEFGVGTFSFRVLVEEATLGGKEVEIVETSFTPA